MKQKGISGKGHGKWQSMRSLAAYRKSRDRKNKRARLDRRTNRQ
jgi:hypothetical protein